MTNRTDESGAYILEEVSSDRNHLPTPRASNLVDRGVRLCHLILLCCKLPS